MPKYQILFLPLWLPVPLCLYCSSSVHANSSSRLQPAGAIPYRPYLLLPKWLLTYALLFSTMPAPDFPSYYYQLSTFSSPDQSFPWVTSDSWESGNHCTGHGLILKISYSGTGCLTSAFIVLWEKKCNWGKKMGRIQAVVCHKSRSLPPPSSLD